MAVKAQNRRPVRQAAAVMAIIFLACLCFACGGPSGRDMSHPGPGGNRGGRMAMPQRPSPQGMAQSMLDSLSAKIELDAEKTEKVKELLLADAQKRCQLMEKGRGLSRDEMHQKMVSDDQQLNNELAQVLSAEEMKAFEQVVKEQRDKMKNNAPPRPQGPGMGGGMRPGSMGGGWWPDRP